MPETGLFPRYPDFWTRFVRAFLYWLVTFLVVLSAFFYPNENKSGISVGEGEIWQIVYILSISFLLCLEYVTIYVLFPGAEHEKPAEARPYARSAAKLWIFLFLFFLFLVPTVWGVYRSCTFTPLEQRNWSFVGAFFLVPAIIYALTPFHKSGFFYRKPKIDLRMFDFRHILITPGMILITLPFIVSYALLHKVDWSTVSVALAAIEFSYLFFCYIRKPITIRIPWSAGKSVVVNLFFILNAGLFVGANVWGFFNEAIRFVIFGVWIGLYMTSFEYWSSVYFKSSENLIRKAYGEPAIPLEARYDDYYQAAASAFTFMVIMFPCSYLLSRWLSYVFLLPICLLSLGVWYLWISHADTFRHDRNIIVRLRKFKLVSIFLPVIIIVDSLLPWSSSFDPLMRGNLISYALALLLFHVMLIVLLFVDLARQYNHRKSLYYWVGGIGSGILCLLLASEYAISPQRMLSLAYPYLFMQVLVVVLLVVAEWQFLKALLRSLGSSSVKSG